ncbi:hypothetical protein BV25DRAFT_1794514 [Artomyces pyxidatus]|uniref:Uncharacterized protein n=1 Tax=Artomyces pyxidatus TaxID=48021 RepID=A0ACB8THA3_9AGAM|nr:hypothetical protein BV25DRAFT_1794514 [Artomyces pyxidatus]
MSKTPGPDVQQHQLQPQLHDLSRPPSPHHASITQLVVNAIAASSTASSSSQNASQAPHTSRSSQASPPPIHPSSASPINTSQQGSNPPGDPNASIQSLLASAKKPPSDHTPWNVQMSMPPQSQPPPPAGPRQTGNASGKRKLEDADSEDPHPKIRRVVRDHVSQDPARVVPMTTVVCMHAAVAQKSYGSEKRFLCPPPVVHIEGPVWHMRQQQMSMCIVSETGERNFEQKATLDNNMSASFKFLHVGGTAKAKSFLLSLNIAEPSPHAGLSEGTDADAPSGRVWASFDSAPVTIISKPSKKTAKTRNISSCILVGAPVSLFNRINSQTVRTKYMTIDQGQLCASNTSWSAFNVNIVRRPQEASSLVTYGSEIILTDTHSGISTAPLIIRKVDKGKIASDDGGPVSQMQKIALQRINPDGTRHYLSATGPIPSGQPSGMAPPAGQAGSHVLIFSSPQLKEDVKDGVRTVMDELDDYLCWTIVGISKFQYTFFDAFGPNNSIPEMPVTPFPTLFTAPVYRLANNTLELTVSNFFYDDPKTQTQTPLDVYLGNLGPLRCRIYQTPLPGPLTNVSPFVQPLTPPIESFSTAEQQGANGSAGAGSRYLSSGPLHTIVVVEMPTLAEVIKALQEDLTPNPPSDGETPTQGAESSADSPEPERDSGIATTVVPQQLAGRSLPLLFIRSSDGVGYHSGRTIACENVFQNMDLSGMGPTGPTSTPGIDQGWLAAAQAAASAEGGLHGWTLRVM